jgi:uncharacterized protein YjbI with pentapeptide repeats
MEKEPDKAKANTEEDKPTKLKAEDNPWYLLATLHGVPDEEGYSDTNLIGKNRVAWNRYFAAGLDEKIRAQLSDEGRLPAAELEPFDPEIGEAFNRRCNAAGKIFTIPNFQSPINFSNVQFDRNVDFNGYLFINASFADTLFMRQAFFYEASFVGKTNFMHAIFTDNARFNNAKFYDSAYFNWVKFVELAAFNAADFKWIEFADAVFEAYANFSNAKFGRSAFFNKVDMKWRTDFTDAKFAAPPICYDAKFYEGTNWRRIEWPTPPEGGAVAEAFVDAYACLKREMDRLKKHEDELIFLTN